MIRWSMQIPSEFNKLCERFFQDIDLVASTREEIAGFLGGVDGFDDDDAKSKGDERSVVLDRFLAAERDTLEALELADQLLDAGASPVERFRKERRPVLGR